MFYEPATQTTFSSVQDFRIAHLHTSFGDLATEEERNGCGLFYVKQDPPPYDPEFFDLVPAGVIEVEGLYEMSYTVTPKQMTPQEYSARLLDRFTTALTNHMDTVAQERRYDNRITCSLRAGYPSAFQEEGLTFATWMDTCNMTAYQIWAEVKAGQRAIPATIEEFIALMPVIEWPPSPVVVPAAKPAPTPSAEPQVES